MQADDGDEEERPRAKDESKGGKRDTKKDHRDENLQWWANRVNTWLERVR